MDDKKTLNFKVTNAWFGITDKYWAATLLPETTEPLQVRFASNPLGTDQKLSDRLSRRRQDHCARRDRNAPTRRLFAGAKEVAVVGLNFPLVGDGGYNKSLGLNKFDLLIDWGYFYFITKPMFVAHGLVLSVPVGTFGLAILAVTVCRQAASSSRSPTSPTRRWRR